MRRKLTYDPARDYYALLGIDPRAPRDDIRLAYRRGVREVHPDLNPDRAEWATAQLQLLNEAYTVLSDTNLRAEYDRLRWPHAAFHGTAPAPRVRETPPFDYTRPWWEQVTVPPAPADDPFADAFDAETLYAREITEERPGWLKIAGWLRAHRLQRLESAWLLAVGLWRSPYGGLLGLLAVLLVLNSALIVYAFAHPDALERIEARLEPPTAAPPIPTPLAPTPTLSLLAQACTDPDARITLPVAGDEVGDAFSVYGTLRSATLWSYEIAIGYLGPEPRVTAPGEWITVRPAPINQSIAEPAIFGGLLTDTPVSLAGQPPGYYAVRLRVFERDGTLREPCDVIVRH